MISFLADAETSFKLFFSQLTSSIGFVGLLAIALAVEAFLIFLFVLRTEFSYEKRLDKHLYKLNAWLFNNKKIDQTNLKEFNELVKKGPKRVIHYWQQFILFREKDPTYYMSLDNLVEKPLKTSTWTNNIKILNYVTAIWSSICLWLGLAYQSNGALNVAAFSTALALPVFVIIMGTIAAIILRERKMTNLDDIYQNYHIFARFISNACVDLPAYVDFDLLFTSKEIANGNPQLREYYESRTRKAKEEFENAKKSDVEYVSYNFEQAGVDGSLVLERAMKETEAFINKKTSTLAKISHTEAEKEALRRNYENIQKDLQRKIQASKENINKLIQSQEATTNRMEVGFLRKQQEQEIAKQEALQAEYDQEETRYAVSVEELNQEIVKYRKELEESKDDVEKAMVAEYQSFYEKVAKNAYSKMQKQVQNEKAKIIKERDNNEKELVVVQTQIKRLMDENNTLRARLGDEIVEENNDGTYDENGNFVYKDGSYHDPNGLFHDIDGKVYDMNGTLIDEPKSEEQQAAEELHDEIESFGVHVPLDKEDDSTVTETPRPQTKDPKLQEKIEKPKPVEETQPIENLESKVEKEVEAAAKGKRGRPRKEKTEEEPKEPKRRGRPKKEVTEIKEKKPVGRPKKTQGVAKASPAQEKVVETAEPEEEDKLASLEQIIKQINQEERRLNKMKMLISSEIDSAISDSDSAFSKERNKILKEIEDLKSQAKQVKGTEQSEELAKVNARLENLIHELSDMNRN